MLKKQAKVGIFLELTKSFWTKKCLKYIYLKQFHD